jgi:hypothetical protein
MLKVGITDNGRFMFSGFMATSKLMSKECFSFVVNTAMD